MGQTQKVVKRTPETFKLEFTAELIREYSSSPTPERLGMTKNSMQLYLHDGHPSGCIEWIATFPDSQEIITEIGLCFDHSKRLTDYDGVFELPTQAKELLRKAGFTVGDE